MKYFFPDSQDLVDPSFDFERETRSTTRLRQRDDLYAHEVFSHPPFEGILVSKAIVDGSGGAGGRYSIAQRHRLAREGVRGFFRLDRIQTDRRLETMGDCGAFSYVREPRPPFSVSEVIDFYAECGFDYGVSVDHVITVFRPDAEAESDVNLVPPEVVERQEITLELAEEFLREHQHRKCRFTPVGVAQGWSPSSYARAVVALQDLGYEMIAIGGLVPLKTPEIVSSLEKISEVLKPATRMHLFGVTRCSEVGNFKRFGATSFDSTSPLRQAFKDDKDNYYTLDRTYVALRVPQVQGNAKLQSRIRAGKVSGDEARRLEQACLDLLGKFDRDRASLESVLDVLLEYERLHSPSKKDHAAVYREVLEDRPWKECPCEVCRALGIHVILFRGAERNRRRGFHNVYTFYQRLQRELADSAVLEEAGMASAG